MLSFPSCFDKNVLWQQSRPACPQGLVQWGHILYRFGKSCVFWTFHSAQSSWVSYHMGRREKWNRGAGSKIASPDFGVPGNDHHWSDNSLRKHIFPLSLRAIRRKTSAKRAEPRDLATVAHNADHCPWWLQDSLWRSHLITTTTWPPSFVLEMLYKLLCHSFTCNFHCPSMSRAQRLFFHSHWKSNCRCYRTLHIGRLIWKIFFVWD